MIGDLEKSHFDGVLEVKASQVHRKSSGGKQAKMIVVVGAGWPGLLSFLSSFCLTVPLSFGEGATFIFIKESTSMTVTKLGLS